VGSFKLGLIPQGTPSIHGPQPLWGVLDDVSAEVQRLLALGAAELEPVTEVGGGIKVAAVQHPFGNRLGLIDNPHFKPSDAR
jgi:predicted enzyme related to lactoylglutathione lyase